MITGQLLNVSMEEDTHVDGERSADETRHSRGRDGRESSLSSPGVRTLSAQPPCKTRSQVKHCRTSQTESSDSMKVMG